MLENLAKRKKSEPVCLLKERVVGSAGENQFLLGGGVIAKRAFSCLVMPEIGDEVLCTADGTERLILAILFRHSKSGCAISPLGNSEINVTAKVFSVSALKKIEFRSFGDFQVDVPLGRLVMNVEDLFQTARKNFVQLGEQLLTKAKNWHIRAEGTVVSESDNHIITAKRDIRIDAERINMG